MSIAAHRILQAVLLLFCAYMLLGGGFFHQEVLEGNVTRTVTWTAYRLLPPPPAGPSFCKIVTIQDYGLVAPCDYQPPFIWWLKHRLG